MTTFEEAQKNVDTTAKNLSRLAHDIFKKFSKPLDDIVSKLSSVESLSDEEIRSYMLKISLESYSFSEVKEHAELKMDCATAIMKETQATVYNEASGTAEARRNIAIKESNSEITVNMLYSTVSNLMKTKLDEAHRVVNTLNSILISRAAQAKLNQSSSSAVFDE